LTNAEELKHLEQKLQSELEEVSSLDSTINEKEKEIAAMQAKLAQLATDLSKGRTDAAKKLDEECTAELKELKMPHAKLHFSVESGPELLADGCDQVQLLFTPNKGSKAMPISKVASGGEIARVTLALKEVVARHSKLPTLILDEVDSGVSGESASRMGQLMKNISKNVQVISITHLPQVAALAHHHYKVIKETTSQDTLTRIVPLNEEERIREIAELLSGSQLTEAALENARNLLRN
jgi:DNA repair protein RecN (Recombination protein N)